MAVIRSTDGRARRVSAMLKTALGYVEGDPTMLGQQLDIKPETLSYIQDGRKSMADTWLAKVEGKLEAYLDQRGSEQQLIQLAQLLQQHRNLTRVARAMAGVGHDINPTILGKIHDGRPISAEQRRRARAGITALWNAASASPAPASSSVPASSPLAVDTPVSAPPVAVVDTLPVPAVAATVDTLLYVPAADTVADDPSPGIVFWVGPEDYTRATRLGVKPGRLYWSGPPIQPLQEITPPPVAPEPVIDPVSPQEPNSDPVQEPVRESVIEPGAPREPKRYRRGPGGALSAEHKTAIMRLLHDLVQLVRIEVAQQGLIAQGVTPANNRRNIERWISRQTLPSSDVCVQVASYLNMMIPTVETWAGPPGVIIEGESATACVEIPVPAVTVSEQKEEIAGLTAIIAAQNETIVRLREVVRVLGVDLDLYW